MTGTLIGATVVIIANAVNAQAASDVKIKQTAILQTDTTDGSDNNGLKTATTQEEIVWEEYIATAYCSCKNCCGIYAKNRPVDDDGKEIVYTASGERAVQGITIAADWSVLPAGTVVEIDGYGEFTVHDKGGTIIGNKIDIYFESHQEALEWGVKTVKLRVIENGGEKK